MDPRTNHYCFGCGTRNAFGLHLEFRREGDAVVAAYSPRREDQGFPGRVHGGLLSVMLDEAMGWALMIDDIFAVTARMETRFRKPVMPHDVLEVTARIVQRSRAGWRVEAHVSSALGRVADALGVFVRMPPEQEAHARSVLAADRADGEA